MKRLLVCIYTLCQMHKQRLYYFLSILENVAAIRKLMAVLWQINYILVGCLHSFFVFEELFNLTYSSKSFYTLVIIT